MAQGFLPCGLKAVFVDLMGHQVFHQSGILFRKVQVLKYVVQKCPCLCPPGKGKNA
ncbi:hypothetical protein ES703_49670 [subsurface metagenome]